MAMLCALDVHRSQITYKWLVQESGQVRRGRIVPACRQAVREWLAGLNDVGGGAGEVHVVLEGTTGWRFIVEELHRAGAVAYVAEPAETAARRGPKRRAKTDGRDCDLMLGLLEEGRVPLSWIPPAHILELRTLVRLRKRLTEDRTSWQQRIQAQLFHQGVPPGLKLRTTAGRAALDGAVLSGAGRVVTATGLEVIDHLDALVGPLDGWLAAYAKAQPGCRALIDELYGVGWTVAVVIVAELGDCRRFTSSDQAVRAAGIDVTVSESNGKRAAGFLSHQGPSVLRWALFEAAQAAARTTSPDHVYFQAVRERIDHNRACLAVARKLARRAHHILRGLGEQSMAPPELDQQPYLPASTHALHAA
jgi:transposase